MTAPAAATTRARAGTAAGASHLKGAVMDHEAQDELTTSRQVGVESDTADGALPEELLFTLLMC